MKNPAGSVPGRGKASAKALRQNHACPVTGVSGEASVSGVEDEGEMEVGA